VKEVWREGGGNIETVESIGGWLRGSREGVSKEFGGWGRRDNRGCKTLLHCIKADYIYCYVDY